MHVKAKMIPVENYSRSGGGINESSGAGEFKYGTFDTLSEPV
jgi:hypothetical protein